MKADSYKPQWLHIRRAGFLAPAAIALAAVVSAPASPQKNPPPEVTTDETKPAFQIRVERNLVLVRVIVRDAKGQPRGDLRQDDFALFDDGKPQTISHFSVERVPAGIPTGTALPGGNPPEAASSAAAPVTIPRRYLALYFDDVHLNVEDIMRTRDAAEHFLSKSLGPEDRAAMFTSSGQITLDFTDDKEQLHRALLRLVPRPIIPNNSQACPNIDDYQAFLIVQQHDEQALAIATEEAFDCNCITLPPIAQPQCRADSRRTAFDDAVRALTGSEDTTEYSLRGIEGIVRRMAILPGQRSVILVSPGFMTATQRFHLDQVVDRALRSNVIVSAVDSRGLWVDAIGDASQNGTMPPVRRPDLVVEKVQERIARDIWTQEVSQTLARDTGGVFFHNSNDLEQGFLEAASFPEVYYALAFSPTKLKADGRFHTLTVKLTHPSNLTLQARRGYFAPSKPQDPATQAKEELREILFSQEDVSEISSDVQTQFLRLSPDQARLAVLTHVDFGPLRFEKTNGLNLDRLTILVAVFDDNGNVLAVKQKTVSMRLRDETLARLRKSGFTTRTSFDVKPGNYLVRQVVRDDESSQMSGLSRPVQISF